MIERYRKLSRRRGAFTLVELLIVVIILAILAAIVVPQFIASSEDAEDAAIDTNLRNLRAAIDLYYQQHSEYPSANGDGTNAADSPDAFLAQLTKYTDRDGDASATKTATHIYGPYLRRPSMPPDPIVKNDAVAISVTGSLPVVADGGDPGGWKFDNQNGQIIVNHSAYSNR